jgi:transposase
MNGLVMSKEEDRTLREMGIFHPHARTRRRAQGVRMLGQGQTLQQVADEFEVHINSVAHWKQCWLRLGLVGLYEGHHSGRPPSLSPKDETALRKIAEQEGGASRSLSKRLHAFLRWPVSLDTIKRSLRRMGLRYKRCRLSLKEKRNEEAFRQGQGVLASLQAMTQRRQCELLYFDETGFGPNPSVQYSWTRIGQTRRALSGSHRQRENVLGALRHHDHSLIWRAHDKRTVREDVIAFLDDLAEQPHSVARIIVLDNARIHKGAPMEEKQQEWKKKDLYLYYLPPYSPELNRIGILWKQAKYFWRRSLHLAGDELRVEVHSIMQNYGKAFTVNFA